MIHPCTNADVLDVCAVINDAAQAYHGVIPADRWQEPYMPLDELKSEIAAGVIFWGWVEEGRLVGVMGVQPVKDVTLIRHAYVKTERRNRGIGGKLLAHLLARLDGRILVGTWRAAGWAIGFYQKYGFQLVGEAEKDRLLRTYWTIPQRQIETSVVLVYQGAIRETSRSISTNEMPQWT